MASRSSNIVFDILANDKASQTLDRITGKLDQQHRTLDALRVAGTAQFVALTAAAGIYAKHSIDNARDLIETRSMATVVFGDQADAMQQWAEGAAASAGLSERAALDAAATFGDMFDQLGFGSVQAATTSRSVVQLAADLGSFKNLPTEDVLDRISAAMRGEYDSLQKLIPNINAARVQNEALAITGKKTVKELTEQDKVTATLAIINRDAANAQGDFARTSGDLANKQKQLAAANENVSAQLGEKLLPAALKVTTAGLEMVTWIDENQGAATALAITVGVLSTGIAVAANWQKIHATATTISTAVQWAHNAVVSRSAKLKVADAAATEASQVAIVRLTAATAANTAVTAANNSATQNHTATLSRSAGAAGVALVGFVALTNGLEALPSASQKSTTSLAETTSALLDMEEAGGRLDGVFDFSDDLFGLTGQVSSLEQAAQRLTSPSLMDRVQDFGGSVRGLFGQGDTARTHTIEQLDIVGQSLAQLVQSGDSERAAAQFEQLRQEWEAGGGTVEELRALMPAYTDALADAENQQRLTTDATEDATEATESYADALEKQLDLQRKVAGIALDERSAWRAYEAAIDAATASLQENGATLDVGTEQGRANQEALDKIAKSTWDVVEAGQEAGRTTSELQNRMLAGRETLILAAQQMGLTSEDAAALADSMGLIPENVNITVTANISPAIRQMNALTAAMSDLEFANYNSARTNNSGLRRAGGGKVRGPGGPTGDKIPLWASDEEWVVKASSAKLWGDDGMTAINNGDLHGLMAAIGANGFAGGGSVSASAGLAMGARPYLGLGAMSGAASAPTIIVNMDRLTLVDENGDVIARLRGEVDEALGNEQRARIASGGRR